MDRITSNGYSAILSDLVRRVGNGENEQGSENVVPETVAEGEEERREKGEEERREEGEEDRQEEGEEERREEDEEKEEETAARTEDETAKTVLQNARVEVSDLKGWETVDGSVCELVIASKCCNEAEVKEVDLGGFGSLKMFKVGDECFKSVGKVKLIGLNQLERVLIGNYCFKVSILICPNRHFYLKNCERLRELKIGRWSFDYSVCEIENVPSLEVIEVGELNEWSYNFSSASLELKSDCDEMN